MNPVVYLPIVFCILLVYMSIMIIPERSAWVIQRLGKFNRISSPGFKLTIGGGIGTNANTAFASMGGRLGFGNDFSDTQRGPNKIVLQNDGAWIAGLGISDDSVDLYSGGKFFGLDTKFNDSVLCYTF